MVEFMGPPAQYRAELLTGDARASAWATAADCLRVWDSS